MVGTGKKSLEILCSVMMVPCSLCPQVRNWGEVMEDVKRGVHLTHVSSMSRNSAISSHGKLQVSWKC